MALVISSFLVLGVIYACLWMPEGSTAFFHLQRNINTTRNIPKDKLEAALVRVSVANKTTIIAILNKAYMEQNGMLNLFLQSFREGECVDFSEEVFYMSDDFIEMMWRRTLFLGDVLKRGYSFIFQDMNVIWLRNPFTKLNQEGEDLQISSNFYNTMADILMIPTSSTLASTLGAAEDEEGRCFQVAGVESEVPRHHMLHWILSNQVITVHSNCCVSVKAKLTSLTAVLDAWTSNNGTSNATWPTHTGFCL
nr:PREDICTED: uncharacterized protein At1g28695-like [Musa acuminata subsp. malaccensis]